MTFEVLNKYAEVNAEICQKNDFIPSSLFDEYGVNRELRDLNGEGVLTGLSRISKIVSKKTVNVPRNTQNSKKDTNNSRKNIKVFFNVLVKYFLS